MKELKRLTTNGDYCDCCVSQRKAKFYRTVPDRKGDGWDYEPKLQYLCGVHAKHPSLPWYIPTWWNGMPLHLRNGKNLYDLIGPILPLT